MKTLTETLSKLALGLFIAGVALSSMATHAATKDTVDLYRIQEPTKRDLERIPKNLARWHMGATLVLVKDKQFQRIQVPDVGYFDESVFLSDNSALTYSIEQGPHNYIIDLGKFMRVSRFFLNNQSAGGNFALYSCDTLEDIDSGKWATLTQAVNFKSGVMPSITFPEVETRYILIRFDISKPGLIGNFGATGPLNITQAEFSLGKGEEPDEVIKAQSPIIDYDFASTYTGTRIAYVSGGPLEQIYNLVDEDPTTTYSFPKDEECIIIVDMRKETQVRTFTAQYRVEVPGTVQVYLVDHLPNYFEESEATNVATIDRTNGSVARAELAATGSGFETFMAAQKAREVVQVPESYFLEIEDSYQTHVTADQDRHLQIFDDLERRYVIYRFVPDQVAAENKIQTAVYRPGTDTFNVQRAQAGAGVTFGQIEVIGDVQFDDLIFTLESEAGEPGGPPEDPPDDPPVISE